MIDFLPSEFLKSQSALDELSVTEIEHLIEKSAFNQNYNILLAKKMSQPLAHDFALRNTDLTMRVFGIGTDEDMPNIEKSMHQGIGLLNTDLDMSDKHMKPSDDISVAQTEESNTNVTLSDKNITQKPISNDMESEEIIENTINEITPLQVSPPDSQLLDPNVYVNNEVLNHLNVSKTENAIDVSSEMDTKGNTHNKRKKLKKKKKKKGFRLDEFAGITSYSKWLLSFKRNDIDKKIAKELKEKKKRELAQIANKSITKSSSLVSEPLADLLVHQGHFDEAKKMYEQLMHKNPEKSRYFAAKIENLLKT